MAIHSNFNTNVILHFPTQTTISPDLEMVMHYICVHYNNHIEQVVMNEPYSEKVFARFAGKQFRLWQSYVIPVL